MKTVPFAALAVIALSWQARADVASAHVPAYSQTTLYRFTGGADGSVPNTAPIADKKGNFFGTTLEGGGCKQKRGCGTVYRLAPDGTETVLYGFHGGSDGTSPQSPLVADGQGNLYGTTAGGGSKACFEGCGAVFEVTQQGVHTILYGFAGGADGWRPTGPMVIDSAGNLYGTTYYGGISKCDGECGTVYRVTPQGVHTVLYAFRNGSDGAGPQGLTVDASGNLYGITSSGGTKRCGGIGCGTVYSLAPDGTETVLYAFEGGRDGEAPLGRLLLDTAGNLYGTTLFGGDSGCNGVGCGTVFKIASDGSETVLSRFTRAGGPTNPYGGVVMDDAGNLFGSTLFGGPDGCGTVFRLAPGSDAKAIYAFTCGKDGGFPASGLFRGQSGELYGTTENYGDGKHGTVFVIQK